MGGAFCGKGETFMSRSRRRLRWLGFCLLTGVLFQTTGSSCSDLGVAAAASLSTAIVNSVIRNTVSQIFDLDATSSLTGLGT